MYEATQTQRKLERAIRKCKRQLIAADGLGDKDEFTAKSIRLRRLREYYKDFSKKTGLTVRNDLLSVSGYGHSVSSKAVWTKRKAFNDFRKNTVIAMPNYGSDEDYQKYLKTAKDKTRPLRNNEQKLLEQLPNSGDWVQVKTQDVNIQTLAILTAHTGDEFAIFAKGEKKILVRGTTGRWNIPDELAKEVYKHELKWTAHSHPTTMNIQASPEDRNTLKQFTWQQNSIIIDLEGKTKRFTWNLIDDMWGH